MNEEYFNILGLFYDSHSQCSPYEQLSADRYVATSLTDRPPTDHRSDALCTPRRTAQKWKNFPTASHFHVENVSEPDGWWLPGKILCTSKIVDLRRLLMSPAARVH